MRAGWASLALGGVLALLATTARAKRWSLMTSTANPGSQPTGHDFGPVDWSRVRWFRPEEFGPHLDSMDPRVIYAADQLREALGAPLRVSPAPGATARFNGNSQSRHYAVGRKSDAVDLLVPRSMPLESVYRAALTVPSIGGIGLYPDWSPTHGVHIDCRPRKPGGRVATWGGVMVAGSQQYVTVSEVFG